MGETLGTRVLGWVDAGELFAALHAVSLTRLDAPIRTRLGSCHSGPSNLPGPGGVTDASWRCSPAAGPPSADPAPLGPATCGHGAQHDHL